MLNGCRLQFTLNLNIYCLLNIMWQVSEVDGCIDPRVAIWSMFNYAEMYAVGAFKREVAHSSHFSWLSSRSSGMWVETVRLSAHVEAPSLRTALQKTC